MMSQKGASGPIREQAEAVYGNYEGDQAHAYQHFGEPYQQPQRERPLDKLHVPAQDNRNVLRLVAFAMALVTLITLAVICLLLVGGTGGWISFCAACLVIVSVAAVAIEKIK